MPNLTFVLPHWLYWCGLVLFPLLAMFMLRNHQQGEPQDHSVSYGISYLLLLTAGFIGMHRLYLRSNWGLLFIPVFIALLMANANGRDSRIGISDANNDILKAEFMLERAQKDLSQGKEGAQPRVDKQSEALTQARSQLEQATAVQTRWHRIVQALGLLLLAGIVFDAFRIPALKRRCDRLDREHPIHATDFECTTITSEGGKVDPETNWFARSVGRLNNFVGTFVAYWSVIAVITYYYEVIARYVFNSPTNWAHESMFLMFGAQYLLAGGFCLRENAHVRVDVFYTHFSARRKALVDLLTSAFFFIFVIALMLSGWIFFMDSFSVREVSFTEWGIQYYPIKFTLALGALLLLLQGLVRVVNDINTLKEAH